ncbi:MAG: energy transducer TonB [Nonlabens sp.]|uniref:energy transducer TonB n=1 Tax=Nonlabens sp. TaxID=1888209 RepID=UPI003EF5EA4F
MKNIFLLSALFVATFAMAQNNPAMVDQEIGFTQVDNAPTYPGCDNHDKDCFTQSVSKAVTDNLKTSSLGNITTRQKVVVTFTISADGNIENVIANSTNKMLEAEATRLISELPQMSPGTLKDGKKVAVTYTLPIVYAPTVKKSAIGIIQPSSSQNN